MAVEEDAFQVDDRGGIRRRELVYVLDLTPNPEGQEYD
jgi:hypothetical protein